MFSRQFVKGFNFSGGGGGSGKSEIQLKRSLKRLFDGLCMHTHICKVYKYVKFTCMKVYMHSRSGSL